MIPRLEGDKLADCVERESVQDIITHKLVHEVLLLVGLAVAQLGAAVAGRPANIF